MKKPFKLLLISFCALSLALLAACGNNEDTTSNPANNKETEVAEETAENKQIIISTVKDFVAEQESNTVEHPESDQDYQIVKNDDEKQVILSDYTGRIYKNAHFVSGSFMQDNKKYSYEIILSSSDADFKEPLLLKYTSDTGKSYTLEEASIYFEEEDVEEDLEDWDYNF
ncbi:hypothetical protein SAMN04487944_10216 [Gracilibacillus ureilyticus]|uniref:Uncharacterized protein n=1 Tax=Gracilibacillus ureilyticus TaxID=531814 RepID=A0A1H9MJT4_9BACI|nr:hypothetical protein [Gracilibacillus ureilyticus]SER23811.1 hypothetical protein SAMN04487944_10216 [Gracilibacillus ureilyticus]